MLIRHLDKPDVFNTVFTVTLDDPLLHEYRQNAFMLVCTGEVTIINASINPHVPTGKGSADMHEREPTQVLTHTVLSYQCKSPSPTNIFTAAATKLPRNAYNTYVGLDLIKSVI